MDTVAFRVCGMFTGERLNTGVSQAYRNILCSQSYNCAIVNPIRPEQSWVKYAVKINWSLNCILSIDIFIQVHVHMCILFSFLGEIL